MALESLWSKKSCPGEAFYRACSEHHVSGRNLSNRFCCKLTSSMFGKFTGDGCACIWASCWYKEPYGRRLQLAPHWRDTMYVLWSSFSWNRVYREDLIETFWQLIVFFTKQQEPYCQFSEGALGRKNYCVRVNKTPTHPTLGLSKAIILRFFFFLLLFRFRIL